MLELLEADATDFMATLPFLIDEPEEEYQKQRDFYLTSSALKDYIKDPKYYDAKHNMGVWYQKPSEALYLGSLIHMTVLEGPIKVQEVYDTVGAPTNLKTGNEYSYTSDKFQSYEALTKEESGKKLARQIDYGMALQIRGAVRRHPIATKLLGPGVAEKVVRQEYCGTNCQIKMDYFTKYGIVDLKTTKSLDGFYNNSNWCDVMKYGYLHSAAFYRAVLHMLNPKIPKQDFYFIAVEKEIPFRVGVWKVSPEILDEYEEENEKFIQRLADSESQNTWVSHYDEMKTI